MFCDKSMRTKKLKIKFYAFTTRLLNELRVRRRLPINQLVLNQPKFICCNYRRCVGYISICRRPANLSLVRSCSVLAPVEAVVEVYVSGINKVENAKRCHRSSQPNVISLSSTLTPNKWFYSSALRACFWQTRAASIADCFCCSVSINQKIASRRHFKGEFHCVYKVNVKWSKIGMYQVLV
jgi:hypothetical protein